ncbi:Gfo/Idh/MocA family oxidoreductase [Comamonas testosteroni]|uniref:Gfo/Idh/MocA family oxidoreductase n=1 Tax=Comamonas testosteroni TaxID=285 RepID=UPI00265D6BC7|nr:Gfo/Idh/MocA family oxidoreductase [Comamonas testosteroni]WKL14403.1 Gfo/Idh/MocA family oxidoreductase [Comamonas testosteroni]
MTPTIRIGVAGLGAAGIAFIPALRKNLGFDWVACADPADEVRHKFSELYGVRAYASLTEMLKHPGLDAVLVATPTDLHAAQVLEAAAAGKHVLVEKPMAVCLEDARTMAQAAESAGIILLVGHSHSHDLPVRRMHELIASGELGRVRMVNTWCYSDWMHRPRRASEFDVAQGGGVTFRQGSHQFDVLRLLCGGRARSVRARTFDWHPERRSIGAHSVWIDFEDGAAATAIYNGYGGLASSELTGHISEWGFEEVPGSHGRRAQTARSPEEELRAKKERALTAIPAQAPFQPTFGLTLVSCERGDIRQSPQGLLVYTEGERREIILPTDRSPRDLVLEELHDAIRGKVPATHDGRWGLANLEICLAAIASSVNGAEVLLHEQVAPHVSDHKVQP